MSVPVSNAQSALGACIVKAIHEGESLMAQLLASASDVLTQQATPEALQQLQAHGPALLKAFPLALRDCLSQDAASQMAPPSKSADLGFGELSLVDEKEHDAKIELVRAQQQATHATEAVLSELNTLVSSAQGLRHVQAESNPLRPANYICALQQVLDQLDPFNPIEGTGVTANVRQTWLQLMLPALGPALAGVYQHSVRYLRQQGVAPAGYSVSASRYADLTSGTNSRYSGPSSQHDPGNSGHSGHSGMGGTPSSWQTSAYLNAQAMQAAQAEEEALTASILHQLLQGGPDPYESVYSGMVPVAGFDPHSPSDTVVAQMMGQIIHDTRLLPAIQQALHDLHPAIQALARQDPEFFSHPEHPARCLLDEITERGMAFQSADTASFNQFAHLLRQAVQHLLQQNAPQAASFDQVLQALKKAWQDLEQREPPAQQQAQQRTPQTETPPHATSTSTSTDTPPPHAETRATAPVSQHQRLTNQIADNIRKLTNTSHVPTAVMQFATGPWAQVIAHVQLENIHSSEDDPHGYLSLVPLLFWSIRPKMDASERQQIAEAVPGMLQSFKEGLQRIGMPEAEIRQLNAQLQILHRDTLGLVPTQATPAPKAAPVPAPTPATSTHTATPAPVAPAAPPAVSSSEHFPIGTWIELRGNRQTVRTQLTWASPQGTLFLFTGADGSTQSMTKRMRDRLLDEGALRVLT